MKNTITYNRFFPSLFIILMTIGSIGTALSQDQYEAGMGKAFGLWTDNKPVEASALFERIAQAEKDNWLPYYYAANTLITASFQTKDVTKINEMLKKAETFVAKGHDISPDNSELVTLEGLLYTGYVAMDPEAFGMVYSNKIMNLHTRAIKLDAENPRAQLNKVEFEMGAARFFGTELSTFCDAINATTPLFKNQKKPVPFYPSYGLDRVALLLKDCKCP